MGRSQNSSGYWRAFFAPSTCSTLNASYEIPRLPGTTGTTCTSAAYGVNRYGHAVGYCTDETGVSRAFIYKAQLGPSGMIDLNTLLPPNSGWVLRSARAINDSDIIVGSGVYTGSGTTAFIMYPQCQE